MYITRWQMTLQKKLQQENNNRNVVHEIAVIAISAGHNPIGTVPFGLWMLHHIVRSEVYAVKEVLDDSTEEH